MTGVSSSGTTFLLSLLAPLKTLKGPGARSRFDAAAESHLRISKISTWQPRTAGSRPGLERTSWRLWRPPRPVTSAEFRNGLRRKQPPGTTADIGIFSQRGQHTSCLVSGSMCKMVHAKSQSGSRLRSEDPSLYATDASSQIGLVERIIPASSASDSAMPPGPNRVKRLLCTTSPTHLLGMPLSRGTG